MRLPRAKKGHRVTFPLIHPKQPGFMEIDNAKILVIIPLLWPVGANLDIEWLSATMKKSRKGWV
jgi:hypothetical protein